MTRLSEIETHISSMGELLDIVDAMRSLAGMRVQEALRAIPGVRRYANFVASAIASVLLLADEPQRQRTAAKGRRVLIVFTAEHGFVGGFNERLLDAAASGIDDSDALLVVGSRGGGLAQERGYRTLWTGPMPTRLEAAPETVRSLTAILYGIFAEGSIARTEALFARYRQGSTPGIERRVLFPVDLAAFASNRQAIPPLHNLPPSALIEKLIAEYVTALLIEAAIESLASENGARLTAMEAAHNSVSKKLEELRADARQARQNEITTELIDLVTGAEALLSKM